jgi:hypothetical protein
MTVIPDRLTTLDTLTLDRGAHTSFDEGHCAMEVVAWLAGEGITDAPRGPRTGPLGHGHRGRYGLGRDLRRVGAGPGHPPRPRDAGGGVMGVEQHDHDVTECPVCKGFTTVAYLAAHGYCASCRREAYWDRQRAGV